jgi:P27 family predicted phage terminase small subunit
MAGRPPKPDQLKALTGTLRPSRKTPGAVRLEKLPSFELPPQELPDAGQQEWVRVMQQLHPLGVLTAVDLSLLKSYCQHVATMQHAAAELNAGGYTIIMHNKGGGIYPIKSPWVAIYNEASDRASKLGQQFGFTPSSRTRIVAPKKDKSEADPWAEM